MLSQTLSGKTAFSAFGIGALFFLTTAYCFIHGQLIESNVGSISHSVLWALSLWAPWLVLVEIGPNYSITSIGKAVSMIATLGLAALGMKLGFDMLFNPSTSIVLDVYRHLPFELLVASGLVGWLGFQQSTEKSHPVSPSAYQASSITASSGREEVRINPSKILYVVASKNYLDLVTENRTYVLRSTLRSLRDRLDQEGFVQSHRRHLINTNAVISFRRDGRAWRVRMKNGDLVSVGESYRKSVLQSITTTMEPDSSQD